MKVRIVIFPPVFIRRKAAKLATQASKIGEYKFAVDDVKLIPHVTVHRFECQRQDVPVIMKELTNIVHANKVGTLMLDTLSVAQDGSEDGSIFWNLKHANWLWKLRKDTYAVVEKFTTHLEHAKLKSLYEPHITLARFKIGVANEALKLLKPTRVTFNATMVALTPSVEFGQVPSIIKRFKLSK